MSADIVISVKWNGKKFDDIKVDTSKSASLLKEHLFKLTSVEPSKQKIMVKGGMLKDDTDLSKVLSNGQTLMMMGTPSSQIPKEPTEKPKFIEDMTEKEINIAQKIPSGLVNLGNTCYMNSTIQCLRAIPELGTALTNFDTTFGTDGEKNLVVSMRELFRSLDKTGEPVTPLVFLQAMRARYPQFEQRDNSGHFMQQDAEECFSSLITSLDHTLTDGQNSFVSKYMTGIVEQTMTCDDAPEEPPSKSIEKVQRLHCHISQTVNHLSQGIQQSMTETIEKNSPTLNRAANYTRVSKLIRLPRYLTIGFVRFFWKQGTNVKAKIMRAVKFPFDLDVFEFCSSQLQEQMKPARELLNQQIQDKLEHKKRQKLDGDKAAEVTKTAPKGYYKDILKEKGMDAQLLNDEGANIHANYELVGVLTHVGRSADAGHYMAWVRDGNEPPSEKDGYKWWKYDDDKVSPVKEDDVGKLVGGGDWHMAYLLVYKAKEYNNN